MLKGELRHTAFLRTKKVGGTKSMCLQPKLSRPSAKRIHAQSEVSSRDSQFKVARPQPFGRATGSSSDRLRSVGHESR